MTTAQLFEVTAADVALTTDDWYTPRWIFDAAGLTFDMDVCAPVAPEFRTCPAKRFLTVVEDGLTAPWDGVVWMNPPYSGPLAWTQRWARHPDGMVLVPAFPEVPWLGVLLRSADAVTFVAPHFLRSDGREVGRPRWGCLLAARGAECVAALARVAAADKYAAGAYHVRPVTP